MIVARRGQILAFVEVKARGELQAATFALGKTWAAGDDFSIADCAAAPALFYAGIVFPFPTDMCS